MATRYTHDYEAFGRLVLRSQEMQANMRARAERVKAEFEATAPVQTGEFKGSARVETGTMHVPGGQGERSYGRVVLDDPEAMAKEFGHTTEDGKHVPGSHALTRALDAAGDA